MKFVKILSLLVLFGALLNASDDSDFEDKQETRKFPYGLIPKSQIPQYIERCAIGVFTLEKKMSEKNMGKMQPVLLTEALEQAEPAKSSADQENTPNADKNLSLEGSLNSEETILFCNLCREISVLYSSLGSEMCDKGFEDSKLNDQNADQHNLLEEIGTLFERMTSIRKKYQFQLYTQPDLSLIESERGDEKDFVMGSQGLLELDKLLKEKQSSRDLGSGKHSFMSQFSHKEQSSEKDDDESYNFSKNARDIIIGSLRIEIPRAISFRYIEQPLEKADLDDQIKKGKDANLLGAACLSDGESSSEDNSPSL